jgi:uncharacterized membrane protein
MAEHDKGSEPGPFSPSSLENRFSIAIEDGKIILTPMPSADELAEYDKILPDFSDRLRLASADFPRSAIQVERARERDRELIAISLVVLVALVTMASVVIAAFTGSLPAFIPLILSPLTALCSAVIGFYFGAAQRG